jgi:hypothetical protein
MMAVRLGWDFNQTEAQPPGFLEEVICYWNAAASLKDEPPAEVTEAQWLTATRAKHQAMISKFFGKRGARA